MMAQFAHSCLPRQNAAEDGGQSAQTSVENQAAVARQYFNASTKSIGLRKNSLPGIQASLPGFVIFETYDEVCLFQVRLFFASPAYWHNLSILLPIAPI